VELIHPGERIDEKVTAQFARATAARIEAPKLRFDGVDAGEIAPSDLGDLVDGEPWVVYGRYGEPGMGRAEIRGTLRGEPFYLAVPIELPAEAEREGLEALWAAARVRDLEAAEPRLEGRRRAANRERIVALGVEHRVATKYTSFVLVEKRTGDRRAHGLPEARPVPVHAPAGWAMFEGGVEEDEEIVTIGAFTGQSKQVRVKRSASFAAKAAAPSELHDVEVMDMLCAEPEEPMFEAPVAALSDEGVDELFEEDADDAPCAEPMEAEPEPAGESDDPIARLFGRQLASGLWEGDDGSDRGRLIATTRALDEAAGAKIDTAHPIYGAQVRKAVEAICAIAREVLEEGREGVDRADLRAALTAASRVVAGPRLRMAVQRHLSRMTAAS
jgi:Ca-activated chloride channel family protein